MKLDSSKILIYLTFLISVSVFSCFYKGLSADLQYTLKQADDEMSVLNMMDHLDNLNTSITYIERYEKLTLITKNQLISSELETGYLLAKNEMDSLKNSCNNTYFKCSDVLKLDSFLNLKISFSKKISAFSKKGNSDSVRNLMTSSRDSLILNGLYKQYNIVYNQGKNYIIDFQNKHSIETYQNFKKSKIITFILATLLFLICWRLIALMNVKTKILAQNRIFSDIINNSSESILTTNSNFEITYCNLSTESIFKKGKENIIGGNPLVVFQSGDSDEIKLERYQALKLKGFWKGEILYKDNLGNLINFQTSINSILDEKGNNIGYFAINADITKLKKAQFELSQVNDALKNNKISLELKVNEQTNLIKEIFERIEDAFIGLDEQFKIIYINKNAEKLLRLVDINSIETIALSRLSEISNLNILSLIEKSSKEQKSATYEFIIPNKIDQYKKIDIYPSFNGTSVLIKDITNQKLNEEEIEKSARFYKLINKANEIILYSSSEIEIFSKFCSLIVDDENIIFSWVGVPKIDVNKMNPVVSFGKEEGYLDIVSKISIDNIPSGNGPSGKAFREGKSYYSNDIANDPNMVLWKDEAIKRGYSSSISLPIILNNSPHALIALYASKPFYFNVQEIEVLERVAENMSFAVQNIFNAKIKKETAKQLQLKTNELIIKNEVLDRFNYIAAHDLQEPLRVCVNFLQLFEKNYNHLVDDTGQLYIQYAVKNVLRMKVLIYDLMMFSKIGKEEIEMVKVDMNEIMKEEILLFQNQLLQKDGSIKVMNELPVIKAVRSQMLQIMQNLIGNAFKFKGENNPEIIISSDESSSEWIFCVKDNGIGIDPVYAEKIFEVFQRLHLKEEVEGTGIGLAICKKIVDQHKGKIWVESVLGEGASFKFSIPKF